MTQTITGTTSVGVTLTAPTVIAPGAIVNYPGFAAVVNGAGPASLTNYGTINSILLGVSLANGGVVTNAVGGYISGITGIDMSGPGTVVNAGTIDGLTNGLLMQAADVTNLATGRIAGGVAALSGTLTNRGTVALAAGDIVSFSDGGSVFNLGASAQLTGGPVVGVAIAGAPGYVLNQGSISGISMQDGGTVINQNYLATGPAIAVGISGAAGTVVNSGFINGIALLNGGSVANNIGGEISGNRDGIDLAAGGTVTNSGQIFGTGGLSGVILPGYGYAGISISGSGSITNNASALILGGRYGIELGGTGAGAGVMIVNHGVIEGKIGIYDTGSLNETIINYGTITGFSGTAVQFGTGHDVLVMEPGAVLNGVITGLVPAVDTIDLTTLQYDPSGYAYVTAGNVLEVFANGSLTPLQLDPTQNYSNVFFHLANDGSNGTDITDSTVPCFLAGTRIATPAGEVAVERLRIGDLVLVQGGGAQPVKWIGRRRYHKPLPDDPDIVPVLIKAGALASGIPKRDLYVSPLHAMFMEGFLVPAGALLNGASVLSCPDIDEISYYHIELDQHERVFAEGAPAETFIDHQSRRMFDNAAEFYALYPQGWSHSLRLCAPRLEFGPELERLRRQVALRAGLLLDQPRGANVVGFLEYADRQTITGWAYAPASPNLPVCVEILNRGAVLARAMANQPRADVKLAGFGHGRCGFTLTLPAPLPALLRHEISVRAVGEAACLGGSPVIIDPAIAHEMLHSGGLRNLVAAAVKGLGNPHELAVLGSSLEAAGRELKARLAQDRRMAGRQVGARRALVLDEHWPCPELDAGSNAIISHIKALQALDYTVAFCATAGAPASAAADAGIGLLTAMGVQCHGQDGETAEATLRLLGANGLDLVYLHRLAVASAYAGLARQHAKAAKLVYAVADLHHLRLARQAEATDRPDLAMRAQSVKAAEFWAMQLADCVLTHSPFEAEYLRRVAPQMNVHVVAWGVAARAGLRAGRNRAHIGFIGGAGHAPNADAVNHLARDIMPMVWQHDPSLRCLVAGHGWPGQMFNRFDQRIVLAGHQPDLTAFLQSVKLTVAPLRFGAGLKGKVLESMAAGTPCVMSLVAAEGLPLDPHLRGITGDGEMLARNILRVHNDKKRHRVVAQSGLDLVATGFTQEAVTQAMARALGLGPQPAGSGACSHKATAALQPV